MISNSSTVVLLTVVFIFQYYYNNYYDVYKSDGIHRAGDWDQLSLHSCPGMSWEAPYPSVPATEPTFDQVCPNPVILYQDTTKLRLLITVPGKVLLVGFCP